MGSWSSKATVPSLGGLSDEPDPQLPPLTPNPPASVMVAPSSGTAATHRPWIIAGSIAVVVIALVAGIVIASSGGSNKTPPAQMPPAAAGRTGSNANASAGGGGATGTSGNSGDSGNSGSEDTSTTTTNSGNTGTDQSQAGTPVATTNLTSAGASAMTVAQSLATALANHDWDAARSLFSGLSQSDSTLQSEYGGLNQSTVVVTDESDNGDGSVNLNGAYVAWETVNGSQQTSVYCIDWDINPTAQQVLTQSSDGSSQEAYAPGWVSPQSLESVVQGRC